MHLSGCPTSMEQTATVCQALGQKPGTKASEEGPPFRCSVWRGWDGGGGTAGGEWQGWDGGRDAEPSAWQARGERQDRAHRSPGMWDLILPGEESQGGIWAESLDVPAAKGDRHVKPMGPAVTQ